jgi:hypothetical protein
LYGRLARGCLAVETSDALNLYFYALTAHFGQWLAAVGQRVRRWQLAAGLIYGQVKKREKAPAAGRRQICAALWNTRCAASQPIASWA